MGSVMENIDCPTCGNEAYMDFNYKTGEETINCHHCGYNRQFAITNWDERESEGVDWIPKFETTELTGCGAYKIKHKGQPYYECGGFVSAESEPEFIKLINEQIEHLIHAEYTKFVDGELTRIVLLQEPEVQGIEDEDTRPSES